MASETGFTRRNMLIAASATTGLAVLPLRASLAAPAIIKGSSLTFWGGLIFSDAANRLLTEEITKWGAANGVRTEVVMINQNETVQRVSAAIAADTMPDALDLNLDLLLVLSRQNVFLPVDDLYDAIGRAHGGWLVPVDRASEMKVAGGARTGIPFGVSGNMLHRRTDLLKAAGFANPPATWEELVAHSVRVTKSPVYGMGLALSNVGDGNTQVGVLQSYGGRIADDTGRRAALKSDATRDYLRWVKDAWDKKVFPPGVTTWDGAGDNNAYAAGQAVFVANTGSIGIAARKDDPDLYKDTGYSSLPAGPKGVVSPIAPNLRAIPRTAKNPEAAKALIEHLSQPAFMGAYFGSAIYGPVLQDQTRLGVFDGKDPILAGLLDLVRRGTAPGYPDLYTPAYADAWNNFVVPRMIQRVVVDSWNLDRAMDEAQTQTQAIYDKYA